MKSKGFTLIELAVVIGIIFIISTVVLINYRTGQQQLALQRAANKLAQDIRRAQEMAMSTEEFHESVPSGGYGVYFVVATTSYILFADCDNDRLYGGASSLLCKDCSGGSCTFNQFSEQIEEIELEEGVRINALSSGDPLVIVFTPPDPTVTINLNPSSVGEITLSINGQLKTININEAGRIKID